MPATWRRPQTTGRPLLPRRSPSGALGLRNPARAATEYNATVSNGGGVPTPAKLELSGPAGPAIWARNLTTGAEWAINVPLSGGQTLVVDMGARTAVVGATDHGGSVVPGSSWWTLAVGANSVRTNAAGTVKHRDGYR